MHCHSDRFVGVASPPVQCSNTGLKMRNSYTAQQCLRILLSCFRNRMFASRCIVPFPSSNRHLTPAAAAHCRGGHVASFPGPPSFAVNRRTRRAGAVAVGLKEAANGPTWRRVSPIFSRKSLFCGWHFLFILFRLRRFHFYFALGASI